MSQRFRGEHMRCNWAKRVLFLADRIALELSPVNLVTEKEAEGRVFVSTYPTRRQEAWRLFACEAKRPRVRLAGCRPRDAPVTITRAPLHLLLKAI